MTLVLFCLASYLAGSVNFSILVTRLAGRGDIRRYFSGNPGTSNVYRILGKWWALLTLVLDAGRGALVVGLALRIFDSPWAFVMASLFCLGGNLYPLFHDFKGGKGVATALGFYLVISPVAAIGWGIIWIVIVGYWIGQASVGSLAAMFACPFFLFILGAGTIEIGLSVVLFAVVAYTHRNNIRRLIRGQEPFIRR